MFRCLQIRKIFVLLQSHLRGKISMSELKIKCLGSSYLKKDFVIVFNGKMGCRETPRFFVHIFKKNYRIFYDGKFQMVNDKVCVGRGPVFWMSHHLTLKVGSIN